MRWLFKTEPSDYSYDDLERDGSAEWTGIKNPLAARNLAKVKKGDEILVYHTGNEKAVVGIAKALGAGRIAPVRRLAKPVPLAEIRKDAAFRGFDLVRISRLSVMPVADAHWNRILGMARWSRPGDGYFLSAFSRSPRTVNGPFSKTSFAFAEAKSNSFGACQAPPNPPPQP